MKTYTSKFSKKVAPHKKLFCTVCGRELDETIVGAEKYVAHFAMDSFKPYQPYDDKTGKRQYVRRYTCIHSKWWNNHNDYMVDEVIKL